MKKFILTLGMLPFIGFGQITETIVYFNNLNSNVDSLLTQGASFQSFTSSSDDHSYDGSPVLTLGNGWAITDTINVEGINEIDISLRVKRNNSSYAPFTLEYLFVGEEDWVVLFNDYITRDYFRHLSLNISNITSPQVVIRLRTISYWTGLYWAGDHYVDDLIVKGPTTEQSMECGFDTDNNGTIGASDLMDFLQYFDVEVNCN